MSDTWSILRCPTCGSAPGPAPGTCSGCGRDFRSAGGGFDLLTDAEREAAGAFAAAYSKLRRSEGWAGPDGGEGPGLGASRLWEPRRRAAERAAPRIAGGIVLDVGSGGGWLAGLLPGAEVVAVDLLEPPAGASRLRIRGDMRRLPIASAAVDACVYCASLHHAPLAGALEEAARVLRPGGLLLVLESPFHKDGPAAAAARERSRAYYRKAGAAELADAYHPIALDALRSALASAGLTLEILEQPRPRRFPGRPRRFPLLLARRQAGQDGGQQDDQ
ncbi:MAG TPA: class I SAM-dependent methyltransferase [Candidatus Dormibacteraeota bacterium]